MKRPRLKVLLTALQFRDGNSLPRPKMLAHLLDLDEDTIRAVFNDCLLDGLVYRHKGEWAISTAGADYCEQAIKRIGRTESRSKWATEALTGIREYKSRASGFLVTCESLIERGVLSKAPHYADPSPGPEEICARAQAIAEMERYLRESLGLTQEQYAQYMGDGRIRVCRRGSPHIGVFDKKGKGWQHLCRKCFRQKYERWPARRAKK